MVAMGRTLCGWPAMAGLALAIWAGCLGGEGETERWTGRIYNTCGPADGPAVAVRVDSVPQSCPVADSQERVSSEHAFWFTDISLDSLQAGRIYRDSMAICQLECRPSIFYELKVRQVTPTKIRADLEVHVQDGSRRVLSQMGTVVLTRCPNHSSAAERCF